MKLNLDSHIIEIPCPKCGKKLKEKLGRLKRDQYIGCPVCGRIAVDTDKIRRIEIDASSTITKEMAKLGGKKITLKF